MNWRRREWRGFLTTQRDSVRLWKLAPAIPLIALVPELAQHAVEIRLGLFESRDAFRALALDGTRMTFGMIKIAGVLIAMLLAARFWTNHANGARWWSLAGIGWKQVVLGFLVQIAASMPGLLALGLRPPAELAVSALMTVISLPGLVLMIGGLVGDRETGLVAVYRRGWGQALRIAVHAAPGFVLLQALHRANHMTALGQSYVVIWALMVWDAAIVALIATLCGAAFHHGYMLNRPAEPKAE